VSKCKNDKINKKKERKRRGDGETPPPAWEVTRPFPGSSDLSFPIVYPAWSS
jgi:hypothetical protein